MHGRTLIAFLFAGAMAALLFTIGALIAAERRGLPRNVEIDDREPGEKTAGVVVAVLDTGVDENHPSLKDRVLPGINVAEPDRPAADLDGHGTAVAGLIAASDPDPEYCGTGPATVRILPVKVTAGAARETLPALLAMGVEKALDAKADVICIAMGAAMSSKSLDDSLERARREGVLVVAAAGIADGSADFWPAAHPWAISCTVSELVETELPDGTKKMAEFPASRAQISGKTELIGRPFAKTIAAGGGKGQLEGSSVPCAKAAGYAAHLVYWQRALGAEELRRLLVLSGPPIEVGNVFHAYPARRIDRTALQAHSRKERVSDLAVTFVDTNPGPMEPGKPARIEVTVENLGPAEESCEVVVEFPNDKVSRKATLEKIPPGASRVASVDLEPMEEGGHKGVARLACASDKNPANDSLNFVQRVMPAPEHSIMLSKHRFLKWRSGEPEAIVAIDVQNTGTTVITGDAVVGIDDQQIDVPVTLAPRETKTVQFTFRVPKLEGKLTGYAMAGGFKVGEKVDVIMDFSCRGRPESVTVQYADAWATKELIIDAPAFVSAERRAIPVLVFTPEVHTLISSQELSIRSPGLTSSLPDRGIWLYDLLLEEFDEESARTVSFSPWAPPRESLGDQVLVRLQASHDTLHVYRDKTVLAHKDIFAESGVGLTMLDIHDVLSFIREDGWSCVLNLPIAAFKGNSKPFVFIRGAAKYLDSAKDPWRGGFRGFDSRSVTFETMLRVRLHACLPKLEASGQYYDIHVHTQCEFSRDAIEPRLAWGGPLWMLVRSAHAMGLVDDAYLDAVRRGDMSAVAAREMLFTTDHNTFLTDQDTPTALPFRAGEPEITTLRRFAGKGANQELAMAAKGGRSLGAAHALVYGAEPMPGPWHGGRSFREGLGKAKSVLDALQKWGMDDGIANTLPKILKTIRDSQPARKAALAAINGALEGSKIEIEDGQLLALAAAWADFTPEHIQELVGQAERVLSEAVDRPEANDNTVDKVERVLAAHGHYLAAHPMAGPSLHWDLEDLDRAANLSGAPALEVEQAGRFPFAGVQVWNEEPLLHAALDHPDRLRGTNVWNTEVFKEHADWHREWMSGFLMYLNRLAKPGMMYTFDRKKPRRKYFVRKLYHYAGSDAHGSFNFTTGVGATLLTHTDLMPIFAVFGQGHGTSTHSSHFACARVYAQKPAFEEVYRGRVVCTDGPLLWIELDSDVQFDGEALVWHEGWDAPHHGKDVDGEIGGDGRFDGERTALVRKKSDKLVLRYRVSERGPGAPAIKRVDAFVLAHSHSSARKELEPRGGCFVPTAISIWAPATDTATQFRELAPWAADGPGMVYAAGFSSWEEEVDLRYHPAAKRCFTNPIWISTVEIGASAAPVLVDGKPVVPPGKFVATFKADHSMLEAAPKVLLKQFNAEGDSVGATYRLVPKELEGEGVWRPLRRKIGEEEVEVDDCFLIATNDVPIPLIEPWYPNPGMDTFAVILAGAKDTHGNAYNAIADKVSVAAPAGFVPEPDTTQAPDPSGGGGDTPSNAAADVTTVTVKEGDTVNLPRGAKRNGKTIPPGSWTVPPNIPDAGIPILVTCGVQTFTLLLTAAATSPDAALQHGDGGFLGKVPAQGTATPELFVRNASDNTAVVGDPLIVTPDTCVFNAPDLGPGACTISATQNGQKNSYSVEAVAAVLAWDNPYANVGDQRVLSIVLEGASKPAEWAVIGTFSVANGEIVHVDSRVRRRQDGAFLVDGWPGDAGRVATVKATQAGKMTATSRLAVVKQVAK